MANEQTRTGGKPRIPRWLVAVLAIVAVVAAGVVVWSLAASPRASTSTLPLQTVADVPLPGTTSRFDYQSLNPQRGRLFIAHLGASAVVVFDTKTQQVVASIPDVASVHGVLAVPDLGTVYATATGKNEVAVIDEPTLRVLSMIPVGTYPDGLAYDPDHHKIFVADEQGGTDTVIDTRTNQVVAEIPLNGEAGNTQYDPVSRRMFTDVQTRNDLVAIDPTNNQITGRYPLSGCDHNHSLLIDAPQRLVFIACDRNATLLVMDLGTMQVIRTDTVGADPDVLALDSGTHRLYVASESGVVSIFSEAGRDFRKVGEGFVAPHAHSVAVDSRTHCVYVPLENLDGKPVLRIMQPTTPGASRTTCG
jgi:YVTN family beta-propeller protein